MKIQWQENPVAGLGRLSSLSVTGTSNGLSPTFESQSDRELTFRSAKIWSEAGSCDPTGKRNVVLSPRRKDWKCISFRVSDALPSSQAISARSEYAVDALGLPGSGQRPDSPRRNGEGIPWQCWKQRATGDGTSSYDSGLRLP